MTSLDQPDFDALRRRVANLQQRDLVTLARRLGWLVDEGGGKGSHYKASKRGRTVVIPQKPKKGTYLAILRDLEREAQGD